MLSTLFLSTLFLMLLAISYIWFKSQGKAEIFSDSTKSLSTVEKVTLGEFAQ